MFWLLVKSAKVADVLPPPCNLSELSERRVVQAGVGAVYKILLIPIVKSQYIVYIR